MATWPTVTSRDHKRFCEIESWTLVRNAKGKTGSHHLTYELALANGDILRTRISHPPDRTDYSKGMWATILRDQLGITESEFWDALNEGVVPQRPGSPPSTKASLPTDLVWLLSHRVGLTLPMLRSPPCLRMRPSNESAAFGPKDTSQPLWAASVDARVNDADLQVFIAHKPMRRPPGSAHAT